MDTTTKPEHNWREQLRALRGGPYAGRGGQAHLAADLGVKGCTLDSWTFPPTSKARREPGFENRARIRRLWESHGLDR